MLLGMRSNFEALESVHAAHKAAAAAFPVAGAAIKDMSPEAAGGAIQAEDEAADHAQVRAHVPGINTAIFGDLVEALPWTLVWGAAHSDTKCCSHWRCRQNQTTVSVQAARVSADAVAAAVTLTNDCIKDGNAVEATSKAAASAWRSSQVSGLSSSSTTPHALHAVEWSEFWSLCA